MCAVYIVTIPKRTHRARCVSNEDRPSSNGRCVSPRTVLFCGMCFYVLVERYVQMSSVEIQLSLASASLAHRTSLDGQFLSVALGVLDLLSRHSGAVRVHLSESCQAQSRATLADHRRTHSDRSHLPSSVTRAQTSAFEISLSITIRSNTTTRREDHLTTYTARSARHTPPLSLSLSLSSRGRSSTKTTPALQHRRRQQREYVTSQFTTIGFQRFYFRASLIYSTTTTTTMKTSLKLADPS